MRRLCLLLVLAPALSLASAACGPAVQPMATLPRENLTPTRIPGPAAPPTESPGAIDLESFKERAKGAMCADRANRLFLIDDHLVFWDRRGNCPDAAYHYRLYAGSPERLICERLDTIAGPRERCEDERFRGLFRQILANLEEPDLGLGSQHKVVRIM